MKHVVLYVPGLGDSRITGRKLLVASWYLYGVRPVVHQMNWADRQPFSGKLASLLEPIDSLAAAGHTVSLVGESAGAGAAMNAYAARQDVIHRVACICGKLRGASTVSSYTYGHNPAFGESMVQLSASLGALPAERRQRIRSVHPVADATVPVSETYVDGADMRTIPTRGHMLSIILGDTLFGWLLVGFLKRA